MAFVSRSSFSTLFKVCVKVPPACMQLRWRKVPKRKPRWMPTAPSKLFRISEHPYVPPDEVELNDELLEEYYRKINSMRKVFQEELAQKAKDEGHSLESQQEEEREFCLLLEENKKENERVKAIREETLEKIFQEKYLEILQLEEDKKLEEQEIKMEVDNIVRKQKEKMASYLTHKTLDQAIERALDNPIMMDFAVDVSGNIKWSGTPPAEFEEEVKTKIAQITEN